MKISDKLQALEQEYPERRPSSPGMVKIMASIQEFTAPLGIDGSTLKTPIYSFYTSLWVYIMGSIILCGIGFWYPAGAFFGGLVFYLLFLREMVRPTLAVLNKTIGEDLILTIPARSKEVQKIFVITSVSNDSFIQPPRKLSTRAYLIIVYSLGLGILILLGSNWLMNLKLSLYLTLVFIIALISLNLLIPRTTASPSLNNCNVMVELAQILNRDRLFRTSVTFLLVSSNSLHSGVINIFKMLKPRREFNYIIDLINLPDKRINVVTADGVIWPIKNHPQMIELAMEAAHQKNIPTQEIKLGQLTATYPLKNKKIKTISVTNPLPDYTGSDSGKDLRETLIGLIRKLDQ